MRSEILYQLEVIDSLADTVELPAQTWQKKIPVRKFIGIHLSSGGISLEAKV